MKQQPLRIIIRRQNGQSASSTGNITGVYDLSGGAWEMTAGYITNGNLSYGATASGIPPLVAKTTADTTAYQTLSTKYATVYPYNGSSDSNTNNYTFYKNANYGYGDAILETSSTGANFTSWLGDYSSFAKATTPFFKRGGDYTNEAGAGEFAFNNAYGVVTSKNSFRAVLIS